MKRLIWLLLAIVIVIGMGGSSSTQAQTATFADVTIDTSFPQYNRLGDGCGAEFGFPVHYTTEEFTVTKTGTYDFVFSQSGTPVHAAIYRNFNPNRPDLDCIDSHGPITQPSVLPRILVELQADTPYVMVKSCRYPDISQFPMPCTWLYQRANGPGIVQIEETPTNPNPPTEEPPVDEPPSEDTPADEPPFPADDRLDTPFIDKIAIYNRMGPNGETALHIYCVGEQSQGFLWSIVTQSDVQAGIDYVTQQLQNSPDLRGIQISLGTINVFEPGIISSHRPQSENCPYNFAVQVYARAERDANGNIIDDIKHGVVIEVIDFDQRKSHSIEISLPFPTSIISTSTREF